MARGCDIWDITAHITESAAVQLPLKNIIIIISERQLSSEDGQGVRQLRYYCTQHRISCCSASTQEYYHSYFREAKIQRGWPEVWQLRYYCTLQKISYCSASTQEYNFNYFREATIQRGWPGGVTIEILLQTAENQLLLSFYSRILNCRRWQRGKIACITRMKSVTGGEMPLNLVVAAILKTSWLYNDLFYIPIMD